MNATRRTAIAGVVAAGAIVLSCLTGVSPAQAQAAVFAGATMTGEPSRGLIVKTRGGLRARAQTDTLLQATEALGLEVQGVRSLGGQQQLILFDGTVDASIARIAASRLAARGDIEWAVPDRLVAPTETVQPADPYYHVQWDMWGQGSYPTGYSLNAPAAWQNSTGSPAVTVAVIDTGILPHPDLDQVVAGYDFISDAGKARDGDGWDADPTDMGDWVTAADLEVNGGTCSLYSQPRDSTWHGLHVAGTIAATQGNGLGVTGVAPSVRIQPVRVLGKCGGWDSDIVVGLQWAVGVPIPNAPVNTTPAQVVNMSLGGLGECTAAYRDALAAAANRNALVVVSAGNTNDDLAKRRPSGCAQALSVVATRTDGARASYSSYGTVLGDADISAPGGDFDAWENMIYSLASDGKTSPGAPAYGWKVGTSMATPHVAGAAALIYSSGVTQASAVRQRLLAAVQPFPVTGSSFDCTVTSCGSGILDLAKLDLTSTRTSAPGAPTNVTVDPGSYYMKVAWKAPVSDGGAGITSYKAVASPGGSSCTISAWLYCYVYRLSADTRYTFSVTAVNKNGSSAASAPSSPAILVDTRKAPGAPTRVTATPGDSAGSVSWSPPADDGGSPITAYAVYTGTRQVCSTTNATNCSMELVNGRSYTFTVTATNAIGTSSASSPSNSITPTAAVTVPSAPTRVQVVAGDAEIVASWTAPANDGGAPLSGYTATASPGGRSCVTATATTCTITGLTNGTPYGVSVTASNSIGNSVASTASDVVTPKKFTTVPGAPIDVRASPGDKRLSVTWQEPLSSGGSPITGYRAMAAPGGASCTTTGATSCAIDGLTNGTFYTVTVTATNAAGTSTPSPPSDASKPRPDPTAPAAPTSVTASAGDEAAVVTWVAPADGGSPITSYAVTASPGGNTCVTGSDLRCMVTSLSNGTSYRFSVVATNAVGSSPSSASSAAVTPKAAVVAPGAPQGVVATAGNGRLQVSWQEPIDDGGSAITAYRASASPGGASCSTTGARQCSITDLESGIAYTVSVTATNKAGTSSPSLPSAAVEPQGAPGAPTNVSATAGDGQATVTWTAPTATGGSSISGYRVTSSPGSGSCTTGGATSCTVTGLTNGTAYTFSVVATNALGQSAASSASDAVTPQSSAAGRPEAPMDVVALAGNRELSVFWTAATGAVTDYVATADPGGLTCTSRTTTCSIRGITTETAYTVSVVARGPGGDSDPSAASEPVVLQGASVPGSPTIRFVSPARGEALVAWDPPEVTGSDPITHYIVYSRPSDRICSVAAPETQCSVIGLEAFTTETFVVVAVSDAGQSEPSAESEPVEIPGEGTVASAPREVQAFVGSDGDAGVMWSQPEDDGGAEITQFIVTSEPDAQTCATEGALRCTVEGLRYGVEYTFTVVARNDSGVSLPSEPSNSIRAIGNGGRPSRPTDVVATSIPGGMAVTWFAPSYQGTHLIDSYIVTSIPSGGTCVVPGTAHACSVTGLLGGVTYTFTVIAQSQVGESVESAASPPVLYAGSGVPSEPRITKITYEKVGKKMGARIYWDFPVDDGGSPIWSYQYRIRRGTGAWSAWRPVTRAPFKVTGLLRNVTYSLEFVATGAGGQGAAATATLRPR